MRRDIRFAALVASCAAAVTSAFAQYEVSVANTGAYSNSGYLGAFGGVAVGHVGTSAMGLFAAAWNADGALTFLHPEGYNSSQVNAVHESIAVGSVVQGGQIPAAWNLATGHLTLLDPWLEASANGVSRGVIVGSVFGIAYRWSYAGAPTSVLSHGAEALGIAHSGDDELIVGNLTGPLRACLWVNCAPPISLHPTLPPEQGLVSGSKALATDGLTQVGYVLNPARKAALWNGSSGSFKFLHGPQFSISEAAAVAGEYQGGYVEVSGKGMAAVWRGTPESVIALDVPGYTRTTINAILPDGTAYGHGMIGLNYKVPFKWTPKPITFGWTLGGEMEPLRVVRKGDLIQFRFKLAQGTGFTTVPLAKISVFELQSAKVKTTEGGATGGADTGEFFRISGDEYVYNVGTSTLDKKMTYRIDVTIPFTKETHSAYFGVK